jgi:hypothetical protein
MVGDGCPRRADLAGRQTFRPPLYQQAKDVELGLVRQRAKRRDDSWLFYSFIFIKIFIF